MSPNPLISHHLFVAAVQDTNRAAQEPEPAPRTREARATQVREVSIELVDFGRPLPADWPCDILHCRGTT